MTQEFLTGVQSTVEPLLAELGFVFDEHIDNVDEGGPNWVRRHLSRERLQDPNLPIR